MVGRGARRLAVVAGCFVLWAAAAPAGELEELDKQYQAHVAAGRLREAEQTARQLITVAEKSFQNQPANIAFWVNRLGIFYHDQGRYAEAEPLYKRSVTIWEKAVGPDDIGAAPFIHNLGLLCYAQGRYAEAEPYYQRALAIRKKRWGWMIPKPPEELHNLAMTCASLDRLAEAEKFYTQALAAREKVLKPDDPNTAYTLASLGWVYDTLGRYAEAEAAHKRALAIREKALGPAHAETAESVHAVAWECQRQGRFGEAETLYQRALALQEKSPGPDDPETARTIGNLGYLYWSLGRYAEAESLHKRALAIREKALGPEHADVAISLNDLGLVYHDQWRYAEAEPLYQRAVAIREKKLGAEHPNVAMTLNNLGVLYRDVARYEESFAAQKRALDIRVKALGQDHPDVAMSLNNLGILCYDAKLYPQAEEFHKRALAIREKALAAGHPDLAYSFYHLARLADAQGHDAEAMRLVDAALSKLQPTRAWLDLQMLCHRLRAGLDWRAKRPRDAVEDLHRYMDLADQMRSQSSGGERERAEFFGGFSGAFEQMVAWQQELGDLGEALSAIERGRARSLLDQLATRGIDLLAGVPAAEAEKLRRSEQEAQARATNLDQKLLALEQRKNLSPAERNRQREALQAQLRQARLDCLAAYADIRSASPAYRLAVGQDRKPVPLPKLQDWVARQNALLLEYLLGWEGGFVLVMPADGKPRLERLVVNAEQARVLGVEPGPLTAARLCAALVNERGSGVLQRLRSAEKPDLARTAAPALAALWEVLIPEPERAAILDKKFRRMFVLPDGALAQLPFETLVVQSRDDPQYLLDVGPPVQYAPSATILVNLADRATARRGPDDQRVLTVGDSRYGEPAETAAGGTLTQLAPRSRYRSTGGSLKPLPFTAWETAWVADVFGKNGVRAAQLRGERATEANVRSQAAGRQVVHLACHGLVDQAHGNFFGVLALTPGPQAASNPADDGFLTLAEVYELNLKGCELAILSACETNIGPEQRGEGVWALSRGFVVAGARRVVASNWLVDDEAAASLVSYFCSGLARAEKTGDAVDYAQSLQNAQRWVRQQEKWKSPFFWGTFVLQGPD